MATLPPARLLSDLVLDSKLETELSGSITEHVFYTTGKSIRERRVRRVERWAREDVLGHGSYGTVYRERCEGSLSRFRAVKEIRKIVLENEELDYTRELEAIVKFSHPRYSHCFVRSDGWFDNGASVFITMEYMEHGDLARHLKRPFPDREAQQIISQVLEGLKYMHDNGFVHRDLKPGNIMVVTKRPEWFVKVADFGISKRRGLDSTITLTHQRGTLGFAAPEQLGLSKGQGGNSGSCSFAADIWALGALAYKLLTHSTPFPNLIELVQYVAGVANFPEEALKSHCLSRAAHDFLINSMAAEPQDRPSARSSLNHPWMALMPEESMKDAPDSESETSSDQGIDEGAQVSEPSAMWSEVEGAIAVEQASSNTHPEHSPAYVRPHAEQTSADVSDEHAEASSDESDVSDPESPQHGSLTRVAQAPVPKQAATASPEHRITLRSLCMEESARRNYPSRHATARMGNSPTCVVCWDSLDPYRDHISHMKCGHDMCERCVVTAFRLSVYDRELMPPRCCPSTVIPLDEVVDLTNPHFRNKWSERYADWSRRSSKKYTRESYRCPSRKCRKTVHFTKVLPKKGRGSLQCPSCDTYVCYRCFGKDHSHKDCSGTENRAEIKAVFKSGVEEGWDWQKCYCCRMVVEREEGNRHMICLCGAHFCMDCGLKWRHCLCQSSPGSSPGDATTAQTATYDPPAGKHDPHHHSRSISLPYTLRRTKRLTVDESHSDPTPYESSVTGVAQSKTSDEGDEIEGLMVKGVSDRPKPVVMPGRYLWVEGMPAEIVDEAVPHMSRRPPRRPMTPPVMNNDPPTRPGSNMETLPRSPMMSPPIPYPSGESDTRSLINLQTAAQYIRRSWAPIIPDNRTPTISDNQTTHVGTAAPYIRRTWAPTQARQL